MPREEKTHTSERTAPYLPIGGRPSFAFLGRWVPALVAVSAVAGTFLVPAGFGLAASGTPSLEGFISLFIAWIAHALTSFVGEVLLLAVSGLVWIAQYNGFVDSTAVVNGWTIVRDVANMFFIVVLLVIAFGTMLGIENYNYTKRLPTLLIMAVVVNFSRTICGLLIDFAQVVMLTFVNGFKPAAGGNFTQMLGLDKLMNMSVTNNSNAPEAWQIALSMLLALALVTISLGCVLIMIVVLAVRIVYLWLLTVLSPLAFLSKAAPFKQGESFYGRWWGKFTSQVVVGPFMAFFIWLALISAAAGGMTKGFPQANNTTESDFQITSQEASAAFNSSTIESFIIAITMLLGGVAISKEMSAGAVGIGTKIAKGAGRTAMRATKGAARMGGRAAARGIGAAGGASLYNRAKGGMLSLGTRVPGLRGASRDALSQHRQRLASLTKSERAKTAMLDPKERAALTSDSRLRMSKFLSPEQKAATAGALQSDLRDMATGKMPMDKREYFKKRDKLKELSGALYDAEGLKEVEALEAKNPGLLINDHEQNAEKRAQQRDAFVQKAGKAKASDIGNMETDALSDSFMAYATPEQIVAAQRDASGSQLQKLRDFGDQEGAIAKARADFKEKNPDKTMGADGERRARLDAIRAAQALFKEKSPLDSLATKDRAERVKNMSPDEVAKQGPEAMTAGVLAAMNPKQLASLKPEQIKFQSGAVTGNADLARRLALALAQSRPQEFDKLPRDMSVAMKDALKTTAGNEEAKMAVGMPMEQVFKSFNGRTGDFGDDADRRKFASMTDTGEKAVKVAMNMDASAMQSGGEAAKTVVDKLRAGDLKKIIENGGANQASATVKVVQKFAAGGDTHAGGLMADLRKNGGATLAAGLGAKVRAKDSAAMKAIAKAAGKAAARNVAVPFKPLAEGVRGIGTAVNAMRKAVKEAVKGGRKLARRGGTTV